MQAPTRSVPLSGASNFRDLGGYVGAQGRTVRWRRLHRSDHLGDLTAPDLRVLSDLGLARVCDFRGRDESMAKACVVPDVAVHALAIEPTVVQGMQSLVAAGTTLTAQMTQELMCQTYRNLVLDHSARFAELFAHLLQDDSPLVFHCTAGKDRTGVAAALILTALGVPQPVVMQDYLLTNALYRRPVSTSAFAAPEVLDVLWTVQPGFLEAALQAVESGHGSLERYLRDAIGLGPAERRRLEQLYLEP